MTVSPHTYPWQLFRAEYLTIDDRLSMLDLSNNWLFLDVGCLTNRLILNAGC